MHGNSLSVLKFLGIHWNESLLESILFKESFELVHNKQFIEASDI